GRLGGVAIRRAQLGQRRDSGRNRIVAEACRAREQQHAEPAAIDGDIRAAVSAQRRVAGTGGDAETQNERDACHAVILSRKMAPSAGWLCQPGASGGLRGTQASAASDVPLIKQIGPPVVHGGAVVVLGRRPIAGEALIEVRRSVAATVVFRCTVW